MVASRHILQVGLGRLSVSSRAMIPTRGARSMVSLSRSGFIAQTTSSTLTASRRNIINNRIAVSSSSSVASPFRQYSEVSSANVRARISERERERNTEQESQSESESGSDLPPNASAYQKFKALSKKYGWYALGMYTFLSSIDFSLCFLGVHAAGAERIEPLFNAAVHQYRVIRHGQEGADELERESKEKADQLAREEKEGETKKNGTGSGWGSKTLWAEIALAYAIHKTVFLPFRAGLTVAWTPKFVGWLTSRGWVGKGGITRAASHAQGKIRTASGKVREKVKDLRD